MGVPRLALYIRETFPEYIRDIHRETSKESCYKFPHVIDVENLFIDFNPIIHNCFQEVYNCGKIKSLIDRFGKYSPEEKEMKLFEMIFEKFLEIVFITAPTKILYIAIDGCAPVGKQAQQRQRRFVAVKESQSSEITSKGKPNRNMISPGTKFMKKLTIFLDSKIKEDLSDFKGRLPKDIRIIFSPASVVGEGEHKIIEFIRGFDNKGESMCMYGPDGDLIMLGLGTHCPNFYLLREDFSSKIPSFNLLHIGKIHTGLALRMGKNSIYKNSPRVHWDIVSNIPKEKKEIQNSFEIFQQNNSLPDEREISLINDFLLLGFFVGNDFLPKIQMFYYLEDGVKLMLDVYNKIMNETNDYITTPQGDINFGLLNKFIRECERDEKQYLEAQTRAEIKDQKYINKTLLLCMENNDLNIGRYSVEYNKRKCNTKSKDDVVKFCMEYLKGIDWVYKYYLCGCPEYGWFYPYHYAPLLVDLKNVIPLEKFTYNNDKPYYPYQQLLSILPPQSYYLLPKKLSHLLKKESSPLREFCPLDFEIDYEGKYMDYQGVARLPLMNQNVMMEQYDLYMKDKKEERGKIRVYFVDQENVKTLCLE